MTRWFFLSLPDSRAIDPFRRLFGTRGSSRAGERVLGAVVNRGERIGGRCVYSSEALDTVDPTDVERRRISHTVAGPWPTTAVREMLLPGAVTPVARQGVGTSSLGISDVPFMKPPPFEYARPGSLEEALRILSECDGAARVLAGGQSLIPLLNFRLARPEVLVDITLVKELRQLAVERGVLRVGAAVTQNTVERSDDVARLCPLLTKALPFVGHLQNRIRGTVAGSIAHADPAAEMPAVALALDATMVAQSATGVRNIPANQFFLGPFTTALKHDEILTEVRFPTSKKTRSAVTEVAPRAGDFAVAGVAGKLVTTRAGKVRDIALALFGVGGSPQRLPEVEARLAGERITADLLDRVTALTTHTARADSEDVHADAGYRAHVSGQLVRRAVEEMAR